MHSALLIKPGKRIFVTGHTGSGKTEGMVFLLRQFIERRIPVVILDTKIEDAFMKLPFSRVIDGLENFTGEEFNDEDEDTRVIIVRPYPEEMDPEILDSFLYELHNGSRNVVIVVDELYTLHIGGRAGPGLNAILTRGRSRKQTFIGGAQRPSWVSLFCLSESDFFMLYNLNLLEDRKRVHSIVGHDAVLSKVDRYHWLWYTVADDQLIGFSPVPLDAPADKRPDEHPREKIAFI